MPSSAPRLVGIAVIGIASLAWLGLVVASWAMGWIGLPEAVAGIAIWGIGLVVLVGAVYARRASIQARRVREQVDVLQRRVTESEAAHARELGGTAGAIRSSAESLGHLEAALAQLRETELPALRVDLRRHITSSGIHDYEQGAAWAELRELIGITHPMPSLRGWAASPDVLRLIVAEILRSRPALVVELGSGASTVWLGEALAKVGGRLVSIEHDDRFLAASRRLVEEHGLDGVVEVRHAPLTTGGAGLDHDLPWYQTDAMSDLDDIDLVFVDGPPGNLGTFARYPAMPTLLQRCRETAVFYLDDADRPEERATVQRWLTEFPELSLESVATEKGTAVLRRR